MQCMLIFDFLNDIIFSKYNQQFSSHTLKIAKQLGLTEQHEGFVHQNIMMQLFSPIVMSQQMMGSQFGNTYSSIICRGGINMVFDEYMGHFFLYIGKKEVRCMKHILSLCICIVQHLCGPDVSELKSSPLLTTLLSHMLETWESLISNDQAFLVEAVEQMAISTDINASVMKTLRKAADKVKEDLEFPRCHTLLFVHNKFLALYSSRDSRDLTPADILFLNVLSETYRLESNIDNNSGESTVEKHGRPETSGNPSQEDVVYHELIMLAGNGSFYPHAVHTSHLVEGLTLLILYQTSPEALCTGLHEAFSALVLLKFSQMMENREDGLRKAHDSLDTSMKKIFDSLKKMKRQISSEIDIVTNELHTNWDLLRKKLQEVLRDKQDSLAVDGLAADLHSQLRMLLQLTSLDHKGLDAGEVTAHLVSHQVRSSLIDFTDFLVVKATQNFSIGSRTSLTINKYMEEFPGLVHFIHIDRKHHRITAPNLDFTSAETAEFTKRKVWDMVEFSRTHLEEGHTAVMWKDNTFHYSYYLWFADGAGIAVKPNVNASNVAKSLNTPGIVCGDFYRKLTENCFPKPLGNKVRCCEIYTIHLGLATSTCVLEHTRRLAATIFEVTGQPNPLDAL